MAKELTEIQRMTKQRKIRRRWGIAVRTAAVAVALCTVNALVLPALTMEVDKPVFCGQREHTHTDGCYETTCSQAQQTEPVCTTPEGHAHTDGCYERALVCTTPEGHTHSGECYETVTELICTLPEDEHHTHTDGCYTQRQELVCAVPEGHAHADECYERRLVCQIPQGHTHSGDCFHTVTQPHDDSCDQTTLVCPLAEHTHTLACYSDPNADLESPADWEATLPEELGGVWAENLVRIARSQLGYAESEKNYQVQPDGVTTLGYTRYGGWYGIPYGDWCAMFVSFCLNYAGVPREQIPVESSVPRWAQALMEQDKLRHPSEYAPKPGDLVFYDFDGDGEPEHMGIAEQTGDTLVVIEGNTGANLVERVTYRPDSPALYAFAPCPVNPEDLTTATYEGQDFTVTAVYGSDAKIPADAQLRASEYPADSETYRRRVEQMTAEYGMTPKEADAVRLFSIGFYQGDTEIEPSAPVEVTLTYADTARGNMGCSVAHFGTELEQIPADAVYQDGMRTLRFTLGSFSDVAVLPRIGGLTGQAFALVSRTTYSGGDHVALLPEARDGSTLNGMPVDGAFNPTYSGGNYPDYTLMTTDQDTAAQYRSKIMVWRFEETYGATFRIYAQTPNGNRYLVLDKNGLRLTSSKWTATRFTMELVTDSSGKYFVVKGGDNQYINRNGTNAYFAGYSQKDKNSQFYLVSGVGSPENVAGQTPSGTIINLFDYWSNFKEEHIAKDGQRAGENLGINKDHQLKFSGAMDGMANVWTHGNGVLQGIVSDRLGADGNPKLSGNSRIFSGAYGHTTESLGYLFDPTVSQGSRDVYENVGDLLQVDADGYYYYDSTKNYAQYNPNTNKFLLYNTPALEGGMFFPFDTIQEALEAEGVGAGQKHTLNHYFGLTLTTRFVQRYDGHVDAQQEKPVTFEFSGDDDVWIFIDDVLVADLGGIHDAADVVIDFAKGTVTIDKAYNLEDSEKPEMPQIKTFTELFRNSGVALENGTLKNNTYHTLKFYYLERGGTASNLSLKYNLTSIPVTGVYKVNQYGEAIEGAEFAVYAAKKDQTGEYQYLYEKGGHEVPRSQFPVPAFNENGDILNKDGDVVVKALYKGVTNAKGEMIFTDRYGGALSLSELHDMFGDHFILREFKVPEGYRQVDEEICLYIKGNTLLTDDTYSSGVYAAATELLSAPGQVFLIERDEHNYDGALAHFDENGKPVNPSDQGVSYGKINYYKDLNANGTMFAVVQKFDKGAEATWNELLDDKNWHPIYGSGSKGYTSIKHNGGRDDLLNAAIEAAKKQRQFGDPVFRPSASGAMEQEMKNLPGSLQDYYWFLVNQEGLDPMDPADQEIIAQRTGFTVAVYWTSGTLDEATAANTWTVSTDDVPKGQLIPFTRAFGANIEVPNVRSRVLLQKTGEDGATGVNGAVFAMYPADDENGRLYYQTADGKNLIELNPDGTANVYNGGSGTYTVDPGSGVITVTAGTKQYRIDPSKGAEGQPLVATTAHHNAAGADGIIDLAGMFHGNYLLREIKAPHGYLLNDTQVMVRVDDSGIYINAGERYDGVSVHMGPGYLIGSMDHLASAGEVDRTLHWIYSLMMVNIQQTNTFAFDSYNHGGKWSYINKDGEVMMESVGEPLTTPAEALEAGAMCNFLEYSSEPGRMLNYRIHEDIYQEQKYEGKIKELALETDQGWADLVVRQDYAHGIAHKIEENGSYRYENLDEKPITKLFSLNRLVQISDQRESRLAITKQVVNPPAGTDPEFTFTVELMEKGSPLSGNYDCIVTGGGQTESRTLTLDENGSGTLTLKHGQTATITGLPDGADFTVTEQTDPLYDTTVSGEDGIVQPGGQISGTLEWTLLPDGTLDNTTAVAFTNTYRTTIRMVKHDSASRDLVLPGAGFTLQNAAGRFYQSDGTWADQAVTLTTDSAGRIEFRNMPDGDYTLTETAAPDGYSRLTDPVKFTVQGAKIISAGMGSQTQDLIGDDGLTLYVPNSAGIVLPDTGGVGTTGITTLGLGLLILAGAILLYHKRKGADVRF